LHEPNIIEHWLVSHEDAESRLPGWDWREFSWCSYSNSPSDPRLHFPGPDGRWVRYISPKHGVGSRLAPSWDEPRETFPATLPDAKALPFHWDWAPVQFSQPLYYTRFGPMVLIHVFAERAGLRFYCSPGGGGPSLLPGQSCPAWDFCWVVPPDQYQVGARYERRMALIYKPFVSDDDVLAEAARCRTLLGYPG
jgi:hypothetical protein